MIDIFIKMTIELHTTIKKLRKEKGWSQAKLAEYAGLDRTTIGAIERNQYTDIGIRKIERILNLLGKSLTVTNFGMPTLDELKSKTDDY